MRLKKFLLLFCASALVAGVLSVCLAPFVIAAGLRLWIARTERREGLQIEFGKIEAPLLRPIVIHGLKIASQPEAPFNVRVESSRVVLALNLAAIFSPARGRVLRALTTDEISINILRNPQSALPRFAWRALDNLLADNFKLSGVELHVENGSTIVDLHNGTLSGAQIEAGVFSASEITIASPWLDKSFSQLRGTTSWQESRLSIGALTLTRGIDLDVMSVDLSQIGENRIGLEVNMDAFGGKIRARVSSDDQAEKRTWDAAGTASEISLAQMSDALELTGRASGSLHACKFTFRGDATNLREATAALWAEVTDLTWRDRTADTIMIGATLYNHQVQVDQLYVKQHRNQLTLTGESALPEKLADWLNPDFHGDISASINDLGDFARLFGARSSDFAGKLDIAGNVNTQDRKLTGQISVSGNSLTVLRAPVESLDIKVNFKESRLEIANFELRRKSDFFRGRANVDLAGDHGYSATFTSSIAEMADYVALIPETLRTLPFSGGLNLDWTSQGTAAAQSGTFHARGRGLRPLGSFAIPFDAEFEGDYSPDNLFFRQFHLSNPHASFSAVVTVARDHFQLQTLRLDLNGKPKLQGNILVPFSLSKMLAQNDWSATWSEDPKFDLSVVLDPIDLGDLAAAVTTQPRMSGQASGNLEVRGTPASLDGKSIIHLRDFVFGNEPRISADGEVQIARGTVNGKASLIARGSDPVNLEVSMPFKLKKREPGYALDTEGPLSATLNFPALFLAKLPLSLSRWIYTDGILSGRLAISDSLRHPQLRGTAHLINGRLLGGTVLSTGITFGGQIATIDFAQVAQKNVRGVRALAAMGYTARGKVDFRDLTDIKMRVLPNEPVATLTFLEPEDCVNGVELSANGTPGLWRRRIDEIDFRGSLFAPEWTISLIEKRADDPLDMFLRGASSHTFPTCRSNELGGKTLTLGHAKPPFR